MRIESLRVENFRSFKDETINFDDYTCLVGSNGAGKSTVLAALNIFFRQTENTATDVVNLSAEDFHQKDTKHPVKISLAFAELSPEAIEDFKDYYRHGKLIVSAVAEYDDRVGSAEVKQYGQRLGMEDFREFFEALSEGKTVADLKKIYQQCKDKYSELPEPGTKDAMTKALRAYEDANPKLATAIPSEDQFYGVSRGANRLSRYVQWVYIPAVKDAAEEQSEGRSTALGKLLSRTVRQKLKFDDIIRELQTRTAAEYQTVLDSHQDALQELGKILEEKLSLWAHPGASLKLIWQQDSRKSVQIEQPAARSLVGEGAFEGDLSRFGHGFQRSYLLALLQQLIGEGESQAPKLILGCEEPELYQHPPQARHLAAVLEQLADQKNQIIVSTHSPLFVTGKGFEGVRLARFVPASKASCVRALTFKDMETKYAAAAGEPPRKEEGVAAKLHQTLQAGLNELFFAERVVLVEGLEDAAYISSWMIITNRWDEYRKRGIHIVPVNGKSQLAQPFIIASSLGIPTYMIFDADGDDAKHQTEHKKDNVLLLNLLGGDSSNPFPKDTLWDKHYTVWPQNIGEVIKSEIPKDKLQVFADKASQQYGQVGNLGKNSLHIASKLEQAFDDGLMPSSLEKLCKAILTF